MVTRSIDNWEKHKEDVFEQIKIRFGTKRADSFIQFYSERYDKYRRSFLDYKLAFWLLDDYAYVKKKGTKWFGCVGTGGTGKTTLLKNVFCFLDPTFNLERMSFKAEEFIKTLNSFETLNSMKACFMDEPDDSIHTSSKKGKMLKEVLGKMRQQHLFLGICATDLKDIPFYIFRKLDGIFFTPKLGKYMFFKNKPGSYSYLLQEIRDNYTQKGYNVFFELARRKGCLVGDTHVATPLSQEEEKEYIEIKARDYKQSISTFLAKAKSDSLLEPEISERDKIILRMKEKGMKVTEISQYLELNRRTVHEILAKWRNAVATYK